jgi:hypothetical protein
MIGLRVKKGTIGEIAAAAQVMREFATKVPVKDPAEVIDIVGTGGDAAHTFNVSTTGGIRRRRGGCEGREARQPGGFLALGQRRRARVARREPEPYARADRRVRRENRHRIHVSLPRITRR